MFSWICGGSGGTLVLRPHSSAIGMPGFPTSSDLVLSASAHETVGDLMERFNTYRGPDHQITRLFALDGSELAFSTPVSGVIIGIVKRI
jgi:hypothetical protein